MPEEEEVKRGKWTFAHLPALPPQFELKPIEKNESRLKTLLKLIKRKDVDGTRQRLRRRARGRADLPLHRRSTRRRSKPIQRLWLQSMTAAAIRDGFAQLRSDEAMLPLADAAVCRSEADWLVGINGTRAMTAFNSKSGGFQLTTVGRVQTPTLAILVEREEKIRAFRAARLLGGARHVRAPRRANTPGAGSTRNSKKADDDPDVRAERLWDRRRRAAIAAQVPRQAGHRHRGDQADHAELAAALRPDEPAARGQRPLRFSARTRCRSRRRSTKSTRC